jgi:FKBP12-rapamycin complex-associated protein
MTRTFANQLAIDIGVDEHDENGDLIIPGPGKVQAAQFDEYTKLLARCHVSLGEWQASLRDSSYMVSCGPYRDRHL